MLEIVKTIIITFVIVGIFILLCRLTFIQIKNILNHEYSHLCIIIAPLLLSGSLFSTIFAFILIALEIDALFLLVIFSPSLMVLSVIFEMLFSDFGLKTDKQTLLEKELRSIAEEFNEAKKKGWLSYNDQLDVIFYWILNKLSKRFDTETIINNTQNYLKRIGNDGIRPV